MRVLICGAGLAGPTLAFWLERAGVDVTLVERAPRLRRSGYVVDFWGDGFEVADRMGLVPQLRQQGYRIETVRFVNAKGRTVGGFPGRVFSTIVNDRFVSIPRGDLSALVFGTITGRVQTIFGDHVTALDDQGDRVQVHFAEASPSTFDLVIGADGLHSQTRALAFGPEADYERPLGYYAAAFEADSYPHRDEGAFIAFCDPGRQVARFPLRGGRTGFFLIFRADRTMPGPDGFADARAVLRATLADGAWELPAVVAALDTAQDVYFDAVSQIVLPRWHKGRVALVGDAAFCLTPLAGEGSSMAMAAAYLLADALKRHGPDFAAAFTEYQAQLSGPIARKQLAAARNGGWFAPKTALGLALRNAVSRIMGVPAVAKWMLGASVNDRLTLPDRPA